MFSKYIQKNGMLVFASLAFIVFTCDAVIPTPETGGPAQSVFSFESTSPDANGLFAIPVQAKFVSSVSFVSEGHLRKTPVFVWAFLNTLNLLFTPRESFPSSFNGAGTLIQPSDTFQSPLRC